jgi:hypothetical protein
MKGADFCDYSDNYLIDTDHDVFVESPNHDREDAGPVRPHPCKTRCRRGLRLE